MKLHRVVHFAFCNFPTNALIRNSDNMVVIGMERNRYTKRYMEINSSLRV